MKRYKFFILFFILVIITGCSLKEGSSGLLNEKNTKSSENSYDYGDVINRINAIKNGLTPKVKPTGKKASNDQEKPEEKKGIQLENLAVLYSKAVIKTNFGDIGLGFYPNESPITVNNFLNLAKANFYDGVKFHRVIKDFMIQSGDPLSKDNYPNNDGQGGPGYQFQDEINNHKLVRGSLAMANSGPNTNGSQFFIVTASSTPQLDGKHTNFGNVTSGMDVVDKIEAVKTGGNDRPVEDVVIESIELIKE